MLLDADFGDLSPRNRWQQQQGTSRKDNAMCSRFVAPCSLPLRGNTKRSWWQKTTLKPVDISCVTNLWEVLSYHSATACLCGPNIHTTAQTPVTSTYEFSGEPFHAFSKVPWVRKSCLPDSLALLLSASALFLSISMPPVSCFTVSSISLLCSSCAWLSSSSSLLLLPRRKVLGRDREGGRGLSFFSLPVLPRLQNKTTCTWKHSKSNPSSQSW